MTLPPLPAHPEPHECPWSEAELVAIEAYGQECHKQALGELQPWVQEGEQFFSKRFVSLSFHLGVWWADRPWRKK